MGAHASPRECVVNLLGEMAQLLVLELEFRRHPLAKGVGEEFQVGGVPRHRSMALATIFGLPVEDGVDHELIRTLDGRVPVSGAKTLEPFKREIVDEIVAVAVPHQLLGMLLRQRVHPKENRILLGFGSLDGFWHRVTDGWWDAASLVALSITYGPLSGRSGKRGRREAGANCMR